MNELHKTEDERIVDYARRWLPFGVCNLEDTLVEFGLTPDQYLSRLGGILEGLTTSSLTSRTRLDLTKLLTSTKDLLRSSRRSGPTAIRENTRTGPHHGKP
ncbi:hypothetical protein CH289_27255 [Rhodococcus sp. RS1C4]|nr:hypothetical protein CH289_27255 [Rhodococcus sp. RS1C4]